MDTAEGYAAAYRELTAEDGDFSKLTVAAEVVAEAAPKRQRGSADDDAMAGAPQLRAASSSTPLSSLAPNEKLVHIVRHAQGIHNAMSENGKHSHIKTMRAHDARLTEKGEAQCAALRDGATAAVSPEVIVVSPLTRTLQTAAIGFQRHISGTSAPPVPMVACEAWRETVNFRCDGRREIGVIAAEHPAVDFSHVEHDGDEAWAHYERLHGPAESFKEHRESADKPALATRARAALGFLAGREERELALVTHKAFLTHVLNYGQPTDLQGRELAGRLEAATPLVDYGGDAELAASMRRPFENAELRTVIMRFGACMGA